MAGFSFLSRHSFSDGGSAFSFQLSAFLLPPYLPLPEKAVSPVTMLIIKHLARYITRYNPSSQAVTNQESSSHAAPEDAAPYTPF
jgi:hypothetical protein